MLIEEKRAFMVRIGSTALLVTILSLFLFSSLSAAAENNLSIPLNSSCACPNEKLIFNCSVVGGGATVWTGSAFSCSTNEIILRHNRFTDGTSGVCNDGAIVGQSLGIENNCSTSQLTVSVSSGLNSRTVMCLVNSDAGMTPIGETTLTVITAPINEVPSGIKLTNVAMGQLTFTWNAVDSNCPSINYLASSNCTTWSCVNPTDTTTTICSGLQLPSVCTFTVQTEVCGQVGLPSDPITVTLRVPDKPVVNIIPVYSADTQGLLQINAEIYAQASFSITDTVSDSVTSYNISYSSAKTVRFDRNTSCVESTCAYLIDVPSDLCSSSSDISVALSASNRLGQGPPSDSTTIGCTNRFVQVEYDRTASTITCRFLDETDTSVKSCNVTYGQCGQELVQPGQLENFSTMEAPNLVYIKLPVDAASVECYNVTASSDVFTVIIQALGSGEEKNTDQVTVIAVTVVVLLFAIVVLVTVSVVLVYIWVNQRKKMSNLSLIDNTPCGTIHSPEDSEHISLQEQSGVIHSPDDIEHVTKQDQSGAIPSPDNTARSVADDIEHILTEDRGNDSKKVKNIDLLDVKRTDRGVFAEHEVKHDCELRDFVENELKLTFKRGCAFYEFLHDFEDISEDKQVIFKSKEHQELYYPKVDTKSNPLIGRKIPKPYSDDYRVFVQSTGSGARHLPAGSRLFYKLSYQPSKQEPPLKLVISSHFKMKMLPKESDVKINELCGKNDYSIFLELGTFKKTSKVMDVIWQDKKDESQLYTGPGARKMVNDHYKEGGSEGFDQDKWRVFVLCKFDRNKDVKSGTNILQYEIPQISIDDFHVLTAGQDEECSSLSKFVEEKLDGAEFINGNAFYEFKREEDLQYYKEVIFWETETDKLTSSIDLFYGVPGVLSEGVKPPRKKGVRVFIQSTSQGARCVKPGDTILYKREQIEGEPSDPHKEHTYENTS